MITGTHWIMLSAFLLMSSCPTMYIWFPDKNTQLPNCRHNTPSSCTHKLCPGKDLRYLAFVWGVLYGFQITLLCYGRSNRVRWAHDSMRPTVQHIGVNYPRLRLDSVSVGVPQMVGAPESLHSWVWKSGCNRYKKSISQKWDLQVKNWVKMCHIETGGRSGRSQPPDQTLQF